MSSERRRAGRLQLGERMQTSPRWSDRRGSKLRILTTHEKRYHPTWMERVVLLAGREQIYGRTLHRSKVCGWLNDLRWAWRLFRTSRGYDVVLTGSERLSLLFAVMQKFLRRRRVPHVFLQCLWNLPQNKWRRAVKRTVFRLIVSSASRIVVYSRHQIGVYSEKLGVPAEKFAFVPSHTTLYNRAYPVRDGEYVFSGGDTNRDYGTLITAATTLPCRVVIVTRKAGRLERRWVPSNVDIHGAVEEDEFNRLMASAAVVVVPLCCGALEAGGRTVYLNAMAMGKPVVVADDGGADDYIENGASGIVVPSGDPNALRVALLTLLEDRENARRLACNARVAADAFRPESFFEQVFAIVDEVVAVKE